MAGKVSPGIYTNELIFTDYAKILGNTRPAIVGGATKGPTNLPTVIESEPDLIRQFGIPVANDYGLLAAVEFLKLGQALVYTRVANGDESADATVQGAVGLADGTAAQGLIAFPAQPNNGDTVVVSDAKLHATGTVGLTGQPADASNIVLNDGTNAAVTFEFDSNNSVTQTTTLRKVVIGATTAITFANLIAAINNAPALNITATVTTGNNATLRNDTAGTSGNVAATKTDPSVVIALTGMTGGAASSNVKTYEFDKAVAASGTVDFTGQPADGETIQLNDGVNPAVTFEFDNNSSVTQTATLRQVVIGGSTAATVTNLINAINSAPTLAITASPGVGTQVLVVNDATGTAGNQAIVDAASNLTVTGMSGGANAGTVSGSNILVTIGTTATDTATNLRNAINAQNTAGNSAVTGTIETAATNPTVRVTSTVAHGSDGNVTLTESTSGARIAVTGMSGGTDANAGTPADSVRFEAATSGTWGNSVQVGVVFPSTVMGASADSYDLVISASVDNEGTIQVVERFLNVNNTSSSARFVETVLSQGIRGEVNPSDYLIADVIATQAPYAGTYTLGQTATRVTAYTAGADGISGLTAADYVGTVNGATATGLKALRDAEQTEFNILVVPGVSHASVITEILSVVDYRGDAIAVIDPPFGLLRDEVIDWHNGEAFNVANSPTAALDTQHGGMFWPWFQVFSEYLKQTIYLPPSTAYLEARVLTDNEVGPWRAAAGFRRGKVNALKLEFNPRREDRDELLGGSNRVNPLSDFQSTGVIVYGNRTLSRVSGPLDSLHVLAMLVYAKKLITTAVQYLQFEPNDPVTWRDFVQTVNPILQSIAAGRGLETFSVKCDAETNPPALRAQKTMRGIVFLKHVDAAEIIEVDFALQSTGAAEFSI